MGQYWHVSVHTHWFVLFPHEVKVTGDWWQCEDAQRSPCLETDKSISVIQVASFVLLLQHCGIHNRTC